jgi:hypothetical protein
MFQERNAQAIPTTCEVNNNTVGVDEFSSTPKKRMETLFKDLQQIADSELVPEDLVAALVKGLQQSGCITATANQRRDLKFPKNVRTISLEERDVFKPQINAESRIIAELKYLGALKFLDIELRKDLQTALADAFAIFKKGNGYQAYEVLFTNINNLRKCFNDNITVHAGTVLDEAITNGQEGLKPTTKKELKDARAILEKERKKADAQ